MGCSILLQVGLKCFSMRMTFDLFDKLLNSEMFCFFHNCMWQSWYSKVNVVLLHLYGSPRSCLIFFNFCRHQHTQLCVDSNPHTGLSVLVKCLTSSWPSKVPFSISFVDSCPPTGLHVLDNWVFGFCWIRWVSLLLPATSESNSFVQLSL